MKVITTVVGSLQTNCYLLIDEETKCATLIDPGDEAEKLLALVKGEGVTLKYILLTHGHRDHTLAVPALKKALPDVPVYIGEADAHSTGIYHYPMADLVPDLKYYGEGDTLPLGSLTIKVLATPGHTLGGVTLLVGDAMFPGDTLFAGSMGRTDLPGGNDAQMARLAAPSRPDRRRLHCLPRPHEFHNARARKGDEPVSAPCAAIKDKKPHETRAHWA